MAEWRFMHGWTTSELRSRLEAARSLPVSFEASWDEMTTEQGWSHVESRAVIAREPAGPPQPNGAFVRATHLVEAFKLSDPRIVIAHFDAERPLLHRHALLELQSMGLHFLCPVMIEQVRTDTGGGGQSVFGFSFVTLEGHLESGREWFLLSKDHATGEVRFHIEAKWQEGEFPNAWSKLGFALFGRRYQRAWHRLAHLRLRKLLRSGAGVVRLRRGMRHEGPEFEHEPIQLMAQRGRHSRRIDVEQEAEHTQRDRWVSVAALGALSGARTFAPLAVLATVGHARGTKLLPPALDRALLPAAVGALAVGELIADKTPWIPNRTQPLALLGRAIAGALVGAAFALRGKRKKVIPSALGASAAVAGTFATFAARESLRKRLGWPSAALGLVEDAVVLGGATLLSDRLA